MTRERVRQITAKALCKFPLLFEDYFREPFQCFRLQKSEFIRIFPEITKEGYEYLSIKYHRGKETLSSESLKEYTGLWKEQLETFMRNKKEDVRSTALSKTELVMTVLLRNTDKPLTIDEFVDEYYQYIEKKQYPIEKFRLNLRTVDNHLSKTKGVVFDRDNRVRFCDTDPQILWNIIDFTRYQNTVISSELIFRDYREEMDALDIRDGYELFCFIKSSASACAPEQLKIHFRRIPTIVFDNASESEQALKLLREWSPISSNEYFEAYEEKYGTKFETVKGNPTVSNLLKDYYLDGQFVIDAPTVDERDEQQLLFALEKKPLWFTSELEKLFEQTCMHTNSDAINRASLRRLGYILHTTYAHKASYGSASNFFNEYVFSKDIVDLTSLDRRMVNLQMFATVLDKKRTSLEYIETSPKLLMSISKVYEVYGLSIDEIREIQLFMSTYYNTPFFNGRSLWHNVENHPLIQKLKGNDWMLTCIMKQQASMRSLPVAGGIILSRDGSSLSISNICEWLVSFSGKMTINELVKAFNGTFGSKVKTYKFAEKLKSSDAWNRVVTESLDEYIDGFVNASLSEINVDDLLQEEFY